MSIGFPSSHFLGVHVHVYIKSHECKVAVDLATSFIREAGDGLSALRTVVGVFLLFF